MKQLYQRMCKVELGLSITLLLLTVFTLFASAVLRTIGMPINWGMDIALLCFTWCVFLGADIAFREGDFVNVDVIVNKLPTTIQKFLQILVFIMIFIFLCLLVYYGSILSVKTWDRSFQGIPTLSYTWVTLSVPISSLLMLITLSAKVFGQKDSKNTPINE